MHDKLSLAEHGSVLLGKYTLCPLLHGISGDTKTALLESLELRVEILHFVKADLHAYEAGDLGALRLLLTLFDEISDEVCQLPG